MQPAKLTQASTTRASELLVAVAVADELAVVLLLLLLVAVADRGAHQGDGGLGLVPPHGHVRRHGVAPGHGQRAAAARGAVQPHRTHAERRAAAAAQAAQRLAEALAEARVHPAVDEWVGAAVRHGEPVAGQVHVGNERPRAHALVVVPGDLKEATL